jgi:hypothetical protein
VGAALIPIIAAASRAEREFVEHFRLAGATAPARSIPLPDTGRTMGRRQVERSVRAGVLRPGPAATGSTRPRWRGAPGRPDAGRCSC